MKIVCVSDTHNLCPKIPDGDIFVHAGDLTGRGTTQELQATASWIESLPHKHKIVIAGNHDFPLETNLLECREILTNCTYLHDSEVVIDGVKFYGSPWQPWFHSWAFNLQRGKQLEVVWNLIPEDTDVLITHGPPHGILDLTYWDNQNVGCEELAKRVLKVNPAVHVFGHIHEGYGELEFSGINFVNASSCNLQYQPINPPIVVEV